MLSAFGGVAGELNGGGFSCAVRPRTPAAARVEEDLALGFGLGQTKIQSQILTFCLSVRILGAFAHFLVKMVKMVSRERGYPFSAAFCPGSRRVWPSVRILTFWLSVRIIGAFAHFMVRMVKMVSRARGCPFSAAFCPDSRRVWLSVRILTLWLSVRIIGAFAHFMVRMVKMVRRVRGCHFSAALCPSHD